MKKQLTTDELKAISEIKRTYGNELSLFTEDRRESKVKVKKAHKRTPEEKIIDMFMDGESIDSIKTEMRSDYHQVEQVLINYGVI